MKLKKNSTDQKLRGAYYTPHEMASAMVKLATPERDQTVLEPSCGDGVFLDALNGRGVLNCCHKITAIEIEKSEAKKVTEKYHDNSNVSVLNNDFFEFYEEHSGERYDLILGNPPYIRYQYLKETQRIILSEILKSHGMKANKLINAWVAFLVACVQIMSDNGTIAFVIPAEILQVAYAEDLRLYLSTHLKRITMITFQQLVFPEIEQEVLVFIGEKGGIESGIRIVEVNDLEELQNINLENEAYQPLSKAKEKWTRYFVSASEMHVLDSIRIDERFCQFSSYGLINVGITTGNNKYFSISKEIEDTYELGSVTLPLIGRSSHAHGIYFTEDDWKENVEAGKRAMLINFPDVSEKLYPKKHMEYIALGEKNGENEGYKCSIRDRWYIVPSVWVPDAFFLRRNNFYPKFVLNKCNAVSTDTMHRMKFYEGVNADNVLLSYYNSISFAFTETCGRSYGGGVLEILPGEMGRIMLPKISSVDPALKKELLAHIDETVRSNGAIEDALDLVDKKLLIEVLGIDREWCRVCRNVWKKLQRRRLQRAD